jgi:hypothetical protein
VEEDIVIVEEEELYSTSATAKSLQQR